MIKHIIKKIRYLLEALITIFALCFFKVLGEKFSANFAAFLARNIGKFHSTHKLAAQNMARALPYLNAEQIAKNLDEMWDNLGRVVGEFVHVGMASPKKIAADYAICTPQTLDNIEFLKNQKGGIIFSAHIGNWEVGPKFFLHHGFDVSTVYRPLNNPYVEKITAKLRGIKLIAKGAQGSRQMIEALKNNQFVIILADQKISEGEKVRFFHDDAITATAIARIAIKYNAPLIPARSIRIDHSSKFLADIETPLAFQKSNDLNRDVLSLTRSINQKIEEWIEQYPSQWFWVHDRWKK